MKQTFAIWGILIVAVLGVVGIVVATGGVDIPTVLPPRGETQIKVFAANDERIVQVGEVECEEGSGDCSSLGVRGAPGLTRAEAAELQPNVRLLFDASEDRVRVVRLD